MRTVAQNHTRPIRAEISAGKLRHNFYALRSAAGAAVDVLAVIKADGYGHGAVECAPVLAEAGATWLGVTSTEEGIAVRKALPQGAAPRVLVMCGIWKGEERACLDHALTPVVWEDYHLDLLETESERRSPGQAMPVHVEIDTGMARQGVAPGEPLRRLLERFTPDSPLRLEGVMTHLASTECPGDPQNPRQMQRFSDALEQVRQAGLRPALIHAGNTSSTDSGLVPAELPALAIQYGARAMTRAGLALYGYALPLEGGAPPHLQPALEPVLTWKTCVVGLREVRPGDTVGYNAAFTATHTMKLALLPVGYADGFRRGLSSTNASAGGAVLLHGRRAPVVGRVSMDLTMVDVSAIPETAIGDEAVLLGSQAGEHIGADEHARLAGTSAYEVLCGISDRVPRILVP